MKIEKVTTEELIKCFNLIKDYLKYLDNLKHDIEKSDNHD